MVSTPSLSAVSQVPLLIQKKEYLLEVCAVLAAAFPPLQTASAKVCVRSPRAVGHVPTMPSRAMNGTMNGISESAPAECLDDGGALAIAEARQCCSPMGWRIRQEVYLLLRHGGLC